ncbi:MAG TPA: chloride channel protein [Spirochaetota bacterium]|nr:chloride channel protein [Spirochaetota bacterium]
MEENKPRTAFQRFVSDVYFNTEISHYISHIVISIILGIVAGVCAVFFHYLLARMVYFFSPGNFSRIFNLHTYYIIFVPVAGGVIIATMTRYFRSISKERGVLSVIKSLILNNGYIPIKTTLFHFLAPVISIGTGAPLGPEGPAAKLGSGIGSFMSQMFRLNKREMKMYTAAGAGAAISAIFNAPIAGVFFGIEVVLLNDLKNQALSALILSAVVADVISRAVLGNVHLITIPHYHLEIFNESPAFLLLGVVCGIVSLLYFGFKKSTHVLLTEKLKIRNEYFLLLPVSLVFGIILIWYYQLFGLGYGMVNDVINLRITSVHTILVLLVMKIIFVALFINAGSYGGTFAPSIGIGVLLGHLFAAVMNYTFSMNLNPITYSLVGMGGMLAGMNSIPLTAIMLVFEITGDYKFILPLMVVSILSYLVTIYYNKGTIYSNELLEAGIDVTKRGEIDLLGKINVSELMNKNFDKVNYRMPFKKLIDVLLNSAYGDAVVVNDNDELMGIVSFKDVRQAIMSHELVDLLITGDIASPVPTVLETEKVSDAMQKIEKFDLDIIPVVRSVDHRKIAGLLSHQDIIQAYNKQLEEWETDQFIVDYYSKK